MADSNANPTAVQREERARREAADLADRAKEQADRLVAQPEELRHERERIRLRQHQIDAYNAEQRKIAEETRRRQAQQDAEAKEAEIRDANSRYAQALGDYDIRDPYGSLARASMTEYTSFRRDREELNRQIAAETDPDKRKTLELRQEIELCDYMSTTSHRIAGQSEVIVGRADTEEAVRQRAQAKAYEERARELRAQYREHVAEQQLDHEADRDEWNIAAEPAAEPERPPRQRGQRSSRGRAEHQVDDHAVEAGDEEPGQRRTQRGTPEQDGVSRPRGPTLER
jgi:hypothetical protein